MIDPRTGAARLVEPSEDPEQIIREFLKQMEKPYSLIWAMGLMAYEDWQKWEPAMKGLWTMLEELDKLGY